MTGLREAARPAVAAGHWHRWRFSRAYKIVKMRKNLQQKSFLLDLPASTVTFWLTLLRSPSRKVQWF